MNKTKTMIYLVRHGETDWNLERIMQGKTDVKLNKSGRQQAHLIAKTLKNTHFDALYTSPLIRTFETAEAINKFHHMPIVKDVDLQERNFGILEGKTYDEVNRFHPALIFSQIWNYPNFRPPEGESANDVLKRAKRFTNKIRQDHQGQVIIVVTHGDVLRSIIGSFMNIHPKHFLDTYVSNSGLTIIETSEKGESTLHVMNYRTPGNN